MKRYLLLVLPTTFLIVVSWTPNSTSAIATMAVVPPLPADAVPNSPDLPAPTIGGPLTSAQLADLLTLATKRGISLNESIARSGWHESFAMLAHDLRTQFPSLYAGARIEPDGDPWIAFKAKVPTDAADGVSAFNDDVLSADALSPFRGSEYRVELISDRGFSEADLDERLTAAHMAAIDQSDVVANASSSYDVSSGQVRVEVELWEPASPQQIEETVQLLRSRSPALAIVSLVIVDDVRLDVDVNIYGGVAMTGCTSGFTVKKGSTRGITTAAHCDDSQSIGGSSLTFKGAHDGYWGDVQWHTGTGYEYDDFYAGNGSTNMYDRRDVSALGTAVEGQDLCRNGKTTYKKCDTVYQLNHCAGSRCHLTAMHNEEADGGDSGGPWFYGNTAYGIHQGQKWWNFKYRDLFTPQGYFDDGLPGVAVAVN